MKKLLLLLTIFAGATAFAQVELSRADLEPIAG